MSNVKRVITCVCCGQTGPERGRGLVSLCHRRHTRLGTLDRYPPRRIARPWLYPQPIGPRRPRGLPGIREHTEEILDVWHREARVGTSREIIAAQLGVGVRGLEKAVERARRRGDPRAVMHLWGNPAPHRRRRS